MDAISLSKYNVYHDMQVPSKLSDYDYDPSHPERRYISTYIHSLIFTDPIIGNELVNLKFTSETCASFVAALYAISVPDSHKVLVSVKNIHPDSNLQPAIMALTREHGHDDRSEIQLAIMRTIVLDRSCCYISLTDYDVELLIRLFERTEELSERLYPEEDDQNDINYARFNNGRL